MHPVFHAHLLRIHEPNDDRLFPGRLESQVADFEERDDEWVIDRFESHRGQGTGAIFEAVWKSGDRSWVPYADVAHVRALKDYFEVLGINNISELRDGSGQPPLDDPQVFLGAIDIPDMSEEAPQYKKPARRRRRRPQRKGPVCVRATSRPPDPPLTPFFRALRSLPPLSPVNHSLTPLLLCLTFLLALAMVYTHHAYLERLRNGSIILRDPRTNTRHQYSREQLRLYNAFDHALREDRVSGPGHIVPGGYHDFRDTWAQDTGNRIQFSEYSPGSGTVVIHGDHIDTDELAPPAQSAAATTSTTTPVGSVSTGLDPRRQAVLDGLIWDQLYRNQKGRDAYLQRKEKRARTGDADDDPLAVDTTLPPPAGDPAAKRARTDAAVATQTPGAGSSTAEGAPAESTRVANGSVSSKSKARSTKGKEKTKGAGDASKSNPGSSNKKDKDSEGGAGAAATAGDKEKYPELMDYE